MALADYHSVSLSAYPVNFKTTNHRQQYGIQRGHVFLLGCYSLLRANV